MLQNPHPRHQLSGRTEILAWGGTLPAAGAGGIGRTTQAAGPPILPGMGGGTNSGGGVTNVAGYSTPAYTTNSDVSYDHYTNFWLAVGTSGSNTQVALTIQNTLSNLTYEILTNSILDTNLADWGVWQVLTASNSVIVAPSFAIGSNSIFFASQLVLITGTNQIADWWAMKYFGTLAVDPYADPDGDGLCNYSEYILGSIPTNAHSMSASRTDAPYFFLAYTNDSSTRLLLFQSNGPGTNAVTLTLSNTLVGSNYQIYSMDMTVTNGAWRVETNFLGTNTATQITIPLNGRTLAFVGGDGEDPDGDGLPSGYEVLATHTDPLLADTGNTGTPDGYKDPDGDGYVNLVEYYNGTDPLVFNTPEEVPDLNENYVSGTNGSTSITWQPASGAVVGYLISSNGVAVATNSPSQLSYIDNSPTASSDLIYVQVIYSGGLSAGSYAPLNPVPGAYSTPCVVVDGPGGHGYMVISTNLPRLAAIHVAGWEENVSYPIDTSPSQRYLQPQAYYPDSADGPYGSVWIDFEIPIGSFTNGIAQIPDSDLPPYAYYLLDFQAVDQDGRAGSWNMYPGTYDIYAMPFLDGTAQMKQNLAYLLKIGSFYYTLTSGNQSASWQAPYGWAYADYYFYNQASYRTYCNPFAPFEDNYFYRNLVFDPSHIDGTGHLQTGFAPADTYLNNFEGSAAALAYMFPTANYLTHSNNAAIPAILSSNVTQWVGYYGDSLLGDFTTSSWRNPQFNGFYLDYTTLEVTVSNSAIGFATISATNFPGHYSGDVGLPFYAGTVQPQLRTVGYYFARPGTDPQPGFIYSRPSFYSGIATAPLMLGSVGQPITIAGYAQQNVVNGGIYAYLGQYFSNAVTISNGARTSTSAGILSECGEFLPIRPGQVALLTKPDPDQTNAQGICQLDIIRLSLDVNHDGTMDESFSGPDNTTSDRPYVFWANNNYDRWTTSVLDSAPFQDDVASTDSAAKSLYTGLPVPDYDYRDANGQRMIPCTRDLQDFTRLWVSGVSNTLSRLPMWSTVNLSWQNNSGVTIDVFQAADTDGGNGYLTNMTTASNQLAPNWYVGRLGPGQSLTLYQTVCTDTNCDNVTNIWLGQHYIFCGVTSGSDQLNLTITNDQGSLLAQSSQYIQIQDIKQMYERWTVGDNDDNNALAFAAPMSNTVPVANGFSPGAPTQAFQYPYNEATDTNDDYILYIPGWNEKVWRKDRWAETAYKRLYWQGYQGRFGLFRWPCFNISAVNAITRSHYYDWSEWNAWKTGQSLETFLANTLNKNYPNHVYLLAHSQGNVVAGEALRLAPTQLVNTYVASQAALSARAYDNTLPTNAASYYTITTSDPQGNYYTNSAPSYFSASAGAGTYVNFYNPQDYALMGYSINLLASHPGWLYDQSLKPDANLKFYYEAPSPTVPSGYYYYPLVAGNYQVVPLIFPTNTYEIFAMCAQSYSLALGAQTNAAGKFATRNQVNLNVFPYNFGSTHIQHDAEFVSDNMTTAVYWLKLLQVYGLHN
jgi:hypothetical protein